MKIQHTRTMLNAALSGELDNVEMFEEPYFGFKVPASINGVPTEVLNPRNTWADKDKYDEQAKKLVNMFINNFANYEADIDDSIKAASPKVV